MAAGVDLATHLGTDLAAPHLGTDLAPDSGALPASYVVDESGNVVVDESGNVVIPS